MITESGVKPLDPLVRVVARQLASIIAVSSLINLVYNLARSEQSVPIKLRP